MSTKAEVVAALALTAMALGLASARGQNGAASSDTPGAAGAPRAMAPRGATTPAAGGGDSAERMKTLRAAAEALGMPRYSDIGAGNVHLPAVDAVNTMEIWGSGTTYA